MSPVVGFEGLMLLVGIQLGDGVRGHVGTTYVDSKVCLSRGYSRAGVLNSFHTKADSARYIRDGKVGHPQVHSVTASPEPVGHVGWLDTCSRCLVPFAAQPYGGTVARMAGYHGL